MAVATKQGLSGMALKLSQTLAITQLSDAVESLTASGKIQSNDDPIHTDLRPCHVSKISRAND